MWNTTGLAVGLSIGVPCVVAVAVFMAFWFRQKKKYRQDLEGPGNRNDDDVAVDLDLDHIVDSPKETKARNKIIPGIDMNYDSDHSSAFNDNNNNNNNNISNKSKSNVLPEVLLKQGDIAVRKSSKIMGLKLVSRDDRNSTPPSKILSSSNHSINMLTKKQSDENYKHFYESVIPLFTEETGSPAIENSSLSEPVNQPQALKENLSHSSMDLTKLLREDSSRFPDSRVTSIMMLGDSPLKSSKVKSSLSSTHSATGAHDTTDPFSTPRQKNSSSSQHPSPGIRDKLDIHALINDETASLNDSFGVLEQGIRQSHHHNHNDDSDDDYEGLVVDDENESKNIYISGLREASPSGHIHRRGASVDKKKISEAELAQQNYQKSRKEWLNTYRPH